jgi:hypothetical protein
VTALQEATKRYQTAPQKPVRDDHAGPGLAYPAINEESVFTGANTKRKGTVIATVGGYTIDDRIEAFEKVLLLDGQLRDALPVRMGSHRNLERGRSSS